MAPRIGTSEAGGTFHSQAVALAELFNRGRPEGGRCAVRPILLSLDDVRRFDAGEIEFGFMASNWIARAGQGTAPFAGKIALRVVSPANAGPVFFVTLVRSPIKTVRDFTGRRIVLGPRGSGMAQHTEVIFKSLGLPLESFTPVYLGFEEGAEALIKGRVDAQFQRPIPNRVMTDLSQRADVRVVPYAAGQLERILAEAPLYRKVTMKKGAFRGVEEDVDQLAVINVIAAHERVKEEVAHEMARTIVENLDLLPRLNPLFEGIGKLFEPLRLQGPSAFEYGGVPPHPGALRAYREAGWLR